jgi:hypothetical protein
LHEILNEARLPQHDARATIDNQTLFDSDSSDSDDDWDGDGDGQFVIPASTIPKHPMRRPVQEFNLDDTSEQAHLAFCELYNTPEFQTASCFCKQVSVAAEYMRTDDVQLNSRHFSSVEMANHPTLSKDSNSEETRKSAESSE